MILDVLELQEEKQSRSIDHVFPAGEVSFRNDVSSLAQPVRMQAQAEPLSGGQVRIRGSLDTRVELLCSRCLKEFDAEIRRSFDSIYRPARTDLRPDSDIELHDSDMDVGFFQDFKIDLRQVAVEQVVLEIPMKPICRPDCKGLCPQCGADRNAGKCSCPTEQSDSRWAALADLKEKLDRSS